MSTDRVNILIVDDEPRNLTVLESILDDPGYHLVRAESGEQALLALMAQDFAALVLDVRMPGMTGFELAQMVKERRRTAQIPIIFLTAYYNEDQHVLEGYGTGAVDYLHKPVNAAVLRSKVAVFAELHRRGRALEAANRTLLAEVAERRRAEEELRLLNETLDRRVQERTAELVASESRLRDANRRKDEFLATLAHELRNPLAPVRNAVFMLQRKGSDARKVDHCAHLIDRHIAIMGRLIDDLMDVSRINQGKIELRRELVDIEGIVGDAVEAVQPLLDEMGHQLKVSTPLQPVQVHADRTRMAQALMNLLNNAAKYMDRGGQIELTLGEEGGQVLISVRDHGVGIPADRLDSVFELFSQVESALARSRGGLGIGLSLTQRLVQLHGGSVRAFSQGPGTGSEFVIRLPAAETAARGGADPVPSAFSAA